MDQDIATVLATLLDPGPFSVYIHGDPGPRNCLLVGPAPCLIDFESGTYGHALLEGTQARMLFPTSPYVSRIPQRVMQRVEHAYRTELLQGCAAGADDTLFDQAFVAACGYWAINFCEWLPFSELLIADQSWGTATLRQRIVVRADIFAQTAEEMGYLEALGTAFQMIGSKLRTMWPDAADSMPLYPAFRASGPTRKRQYPG